MIYLPENYNLRVSEEKIGQLYPILLDAHGNIIDGKHRLRANPSWKTTKLKHIKTEKDMIKARIIANNQRRNVPKREKIEDLGQLARLLIDEEQMPIGKLSSRIMKETGMSYQWVMKYLPDEFKRNYNSPQHNSPQRRELEQQSSFIPEETNLWTFYKFDERFGFNYPGRIPGQVIQNLLFYFTWKGHVIVDPFAGSGTTIDVCKVMDRKCIAFDLHPARPDIRQNDATKGIPLEDSSADFILLDPPYWKKLRSLYSNDENDFANLSLDEFYARMNKVAEECWRILKENRHIALLMSTYVMQKGNFIDLTFNCYQIFLDKGFIPIERIVIPRSINQHARGTSVWKWRAQRSPFLFRGYLDLLVMKKEWSLQ